MSTPPSLGDVLNAILSAVLSVLNAIVNVLSENAALVATVLVVGGATYAIFRFGRRILSGITDMIQGLF